MASQSASGGLSVSLQMARILAKPGYLTAANGGQRLRELYVAGSMHFDISKLSPFGIKCCVGDLDGIRKDIESGEAPPLDGTETPYQDGYATLIVLGAQRVRPVGGDCQTFHIEALRYLISRGLSIDKEDILGHTALFHATSFQAPQIELARVLVGAGANVNHRNRFGEIGLMSALQANNLECIDLLMEHGADIDIPEADGLTARKLLVTCGPEATAMVSKWLRKRTGETALMEDKTCLVCGKEDKALKLCAKCKSVRYCSVECQRQDWPKHKPTCVPFSNENTVTLKPFYHPGSTLPRAHLLRTGLGIDSPAPKASHHIASAVPKSIDRKSKDIIIKVQVPLDFTLRDLMVYTKKRDFACSIRRIDAPAAYDRITQAIRTKGISGAKGYFTAVLEDQNTLVVKVSELLATQPF